jgi:hypothetical protein
MYAMHNAFRRDLTRLERAVGHPEPSRGGWEVFREEVEFHHQWSACRVDRLEREVPPAFECIRAVGSNVRGQPGGGCSRTVSPMARCR